MVRVTCLYPTKSYSYCSSAFAHLETLDLQSSNNNSSTWSKHRATIQSKQKVQLKTIHQNKRKALKNVLKDRARCYGHKNARSAENGARVWKETTIERFILYKKAK